MFFVAVFFIELFLLFFVSRLLTKSLSQLFFRISKSQITTIHLLSILFLPGVIVHELAHMLMASILFVPVGEIEFFPQLIEHGVKLGSVAIGKTDPVRRALIGVAPVLVGIILLLGVLFYISSPLDLTSKSGLAVFFLTAYISFEVGNTMFSSSKDLEGTIELLGAIFLIALLLYFVGVRIDFSYIQGLFSVEIIEFIKKADFFLFLPIAIDLGVWGTMKLLR